MGLPIGARFRPLSRRRLAGACLGSRVMMNADCFALMGAMGWWAWLMPLAFLLLLGLGIAALVKYLFQSHKGDRR
ncbi:hypothetical protein HPA02_10950 [Bisbaumannia pacifica]|uniref:Uncharacterized protein n=2 Tax=Bisbaumannia pacifica TaxID=77098 RepID=A0A510X5X7_9GAMM|nr:hypothetical protein HPA02_10950 [Halomonas pacifica]